jgi:hypothetical protein
MGLGRKGRRRGGAHVTVTERCERGRLWCFGRGEGRKRGTEKQRGERRGLYPAKAATGPYTRLARCGLTV